MYSEWYKVWIVPRFRLQDKSIGRTASLAAPSVLRCVIVNAVIFIVQTNVWVVREIYMEAQNVLETPVEALTDRETEVLKLVAEGLSNREISEALFISLETVKWYNRQIFRKLDVKSRTQATVRARELDLFSSIVEDHDGEIHHLPSSLTSFVGRRNEIQDIRQLLDLSRLITLTGVGGSGKTRLSIELARELGPLYEDGVYFVSLSSVDTACLVGPAIAEALNLQWGMGQSPCESLVEYLYDKHVLLILDNFEHVLEAGNLISDILVAAPLVSVLVTSREVLHLYGEREYPLSPLSLPNLTRLDPIETVVEYEAVNLFVDRLQSMQPEMEFTEDDIQTIAAICVALDGLPLALELAAARFKILSLQSILERLNNRLGLLTGGLRDMPSRQQTLRGTIDWSYELLTDCEKQLFANLAVFRGGCTLEAVEAVCTQGLPLDDILDGLASLVDKSLISPKRGVDEETRFRMLETIREYALERLAENNQLELMQKRHAEYFLSLIERGDAEHHGKNQAQWFKRFEAEHDNVREVLHWVLQSGNAELGLRMVPALSWFWDTRNTVGEGYAWGERILAIGDKVTPAIRAKALQKIGGRLAVVYGNHQRAEEMLEESVAILRDSGDQLGLAWALNHLSNVNKIEARAEEALALFAELDEKPGYAWTLNTLGELARSTERYEQAQTYYEESLALAEELGNGKLKATVLHNLAHAVFCVNDYEKANVLFSEALQIANELDGIILCVISIAGLASVAALSGRFETAATLYGYVEAAQEKVSFEIEPVDRYNLERGLAVLKDEMDSADFEYVLNRGRKMTMAQAVAFGLAENEVMVGVG